MLRLPENLAVVLSHHLLVRRKYSEPAKEIRSESVEYHRSAHVEASRNELVEERSLRFVEQAFGVNSVECSRCFRSPASQNYHTAGKRIMNLWMDGNKQRDARRVCRRTAG